MITTKDLVATIRVRMDTGQTLTLAAVLVTAAATLALAVITYFLIRANKRIIEAAEKEASASLAIVKEMQQDREVERQRERADLIGAIQVTRSEIAGNIASINDKIDKGSEHLNIELLDASSRSVQTTLAHGLPMPLFGWIGTVNNQLGRVRSMIERARPHGGMSNNEIMDTRELRSRLTNANRFLLRYLRESLNVEVADIPLDATTTPEKIEASLEKILFGDKSSQ